MPTCFRGVAKPVGRDTFGAYARRWVDGYRGRSGTRLDIRRAIDAMEPYVGHLRLVEIRPTGLAAAYRGLENGTKQAPSAKRRRRGLATSTVTRYANWVNTIVDELTRFCDWALTEDEPWARAWAILARTGLRSGSSSGCDGVTSTSIGAR